ncbi:type II toxin-antitoxin system RelE/ParE family toxin [Alicyclobacillus macrosporangiidus]|uniref:Phage-related protein n=1 Tax=Alicyclobacillus macrosporangiidus TaxID=392015 RepID=A0A1I7L246_9BACL|nr:type II toxin-antitoxin system RelE/ParE family toxin [Alicyclobacillus macrosporangiidus]SFV03800.1 Phage-related protein [Alicyclobacillus macrosporangiidus]
MTYDIVFYVDARGRSPVYEFLKDLSTKAAQGKKDAVSLKKQVDLHLEILKTYGTRIGEPYVDYLGDGIWELRPGSHRILFVAWSNGRFVLLHEFRKTTRKTPRREIEKAKRELADWIERHGK